MSEDNLKIWNEVEQTPANYVSELTGKGYKAKSANPMYLTRMATKVFGPMGKGWGTTALNEETEVIGDTHLFHLHLELWYVVGGETHRVNHRSSIKVAYTTNAGKLLVDEEARKKCQTNAMSKCLSLLGFAADIWLKYYDSPAYLDAREKEADREDAALKLRDKYRAIVQTLDDKCLCRTEADRTDICRWVLEDPEFTLGAMQVTPGLSEKVKEEMARVHDQGVMPFKMLEKAREWNKAITEF